MFLPEVQGWCLQEIQASSARKNKKGGFKNIKVGIFLLTADEICVCVYSYYYHSALHIKYKIYTLTQGFCNEKLII